MKISKQVLLGLTTTVGLYSNLGLASCNYDQIHKFDSLSFSARGDEYKKLATLLRSEIEIEKNDLKRQRSISGVAQLFEGTSGTQEFSTAGRYLELSALRSSMVTQDTLNLASSYIYKLNETVDCYDLLSAEFQKLAQDTSDLQRKVLGPHRHRIDFAFQIYRWDAYLTGIITQFQTNNGAASAANYLSYALANNYKELSSKLIRGEFTPNHLELVPYFQEIAKIGRYYSMIAERVKMPFTTPDERNIFFRDWQSHLANKKAASDNILLPFYSELVSYLDSSAKEV